MSGSNEFYAWIDKFRVKPKEPCTHGSMNSPMGSYYIHTTKDLASFWTRYQNAHARSQHLSITEKPELYTPLRVDFDFKYKSDNLERIYTKSEIKRIISYFQEVILDIVDPEVITMEPRTLWCIVLEKKKPRATEDEEVKKDGFHLHFPFFICEDWVFQYSRKVVAEKLKKDKMWEGKNLLKSVTETIDRGIARKTWLIHGSTKQKGTEPYIATYGVDSSCNEVSFANIFSDEMVDRKNRVSYYLPSFLSIRGYQEPTSLNANSESRRRSIIPKPVVKAITKKRSAKEVAEDMKVIIDGDIMEMLSEERADNYTDWLDVGWTLFNVGQGSDEALRMWINFSKKSDKFMDGQCESEWGKMEMRNKSLGSLLAMAKRDNPNLFENWRKTNVRYHLFKCLVEPNPSEYDVSVVVAKKYEGIFLCADAKKDIWYEFRDHRWHEMDDAISLRKLFATEIVQLFQELKLEFVQKQKPDEDEIEYRKYKEQQQRCEKIIEKLKTVKFHNNLMKMCKLHMYDAKFYKKMDQDKKLMGCENGVIDLYFNIFREGRPDDYITMSNGLNYPTRTPDRDDLKFMNTYFRQLYPNPNIRQFALDTFAQCIEGGNLNKQFVIFTNDGDGGKSELIILLEKMMGDYMGKFPRELFVTKAMGGSGPKDELHRTTGKRIMTVDEIAANEEINVGVLKLLTGKDSYYARTLHSKGEEIRPQFTLFVQCNTLPKIPGNDQATWNRVRVVNHESHFNKKAPVDEEEQWRLKHFPADQDVINRVHSLADVLLWMMFERYKEFDHRKISIPKEVTAATEEYRSENDIYKLFVNEFVEITKDPKDKINTTVMFTKFTEWFKDEFSGYGKEKFAKNVVQKNFEPYFGKPTRTRTKDYVGVKFTDEESEEVGEIR
jgi:P4 family phage/plasmid primase-like protien